MDSRASSYLFRKPSFPYIVYVSSYNPLSSGVRALHLLCHALNRIGHEAYVMAGVTDPWLVTPTAHTIRRGQFSADGRPAIVVYPEVIEDNPLNEPVVARWLLNKPGALVENWDGDYQPDDMIFHYDPDFLPEGLKGSLLHLPTSDIGVYNNIDNPHDKSRQGYALYTSRYRATGEPIADFLRDATVISPDNPRTPRQLAEIYRRSEFLFAYERSAATLEATFCGCPVIYLESSLLREIPAQKTFGKAGFAWGFSEAEAKRAKETVHETWEIYQGLLNSFDDQLARFVEVTQERARQISESAVSVRA